MRSSSFLRTVIGPVGLVASVIAPAFTGGAFAQITITLDQNPLTVVRPQSGSLVASITGTVSVGTGWAIGGFGVLDQAANGGGDALVVDFSESFLNYISLASPGDDYTGSLFDVTVTASTTPGLYDRDAGNLSEPAQFVYTAFDGPNGSVQTLDYAVNIVAMGAAAPEPGTLALLVLPTVGLLARRPRR
ncbi:MAG: hypothetical protein SFU56_20615 [Capsulimonadales bacterium]|nr:hypothetical protein [Capsulimonadales bacterium]